MVDGGDGHTIIIINIGNVKGMEQWRMDIRKGGGGTMNEGVMMGVNIEKGAYWWSWTKKI